MSNDSQINELIEEILDSDRTPEEVCVELPDLLGEVKARLRKVRAFEAELDSLFPSTAIEESTSPVNLGETGLPRIPGYEVQAVLGAGGMGVVYKAVHLQLNRVVALKMLLSGQYASRQEHARFLREAEAVARLKHQNIVQIYDIGDVDGRPYFTMEYIEGGNLSEKIARSPRPVTESAQMIATLANAVHAAHQSEIIHRDIKPANVLLNRDGTPKINDFGLARRLNTDDGLTHTGARMGTPSYMAPEQMTGDPTAVGPAIDIFALGAILYEMLTGEPPFKGTTLSDTERRLTSVDPDPPSRRNAKVPRDLETICLKCLEKDPIRRFATAGELAEDLARFLRHEPIRARPVSRIERCARWIRRNPLPTTLAVTGILLIGLIIIDSLQNGALVASRLAEKSRLTARLESGVQLIQEGRLAEARAILEKLGDGGSGDLRQRIDQAVSDLSLVENLDSAGTKRSMVLKETDGDRVNRLNAAANYATLFSMAGLGDVGAESKQAGQRIRSSEIRSLLVTFLEDWSVCEVDARKRRWVLEVIREADIAPSSWSLRLRDPENWNHVDALQTLEQSAPEAGRPVQSLRVLGDRMEAAGLDTVPFLTQVQDDHPDSFLANLVLANSLHSVNAPEAIRFYQAALAIRPKSATAHNNLGVALSILGRSTEALSHYKHALETDLKSVSIPYNMGLELLESGRAPEAIPYLETATRLAPALYETYVHLATALLEVGRPSDARDLLESILTATPSGSAVRSRLDQLLEQCQQALSLPPDRTLDPH
ncbi:protein kinase [Schlesneria sp. T3-172]|uniref:serine/threonine-protein kinase n=1 Tax=Schlesneria sphaerica TaxID=3373610 RepID=UPI0037C79333